MSNESVDRWRWIAANFRCLILVDDVMELNAWRQLVGPPLSVRFWRTDASNDVAANIKFGMELLGSQPFETAYVTFDQADLLEAVPTRAGTIQVGMQIGDVFPDLFCSNPADLEAKLRAWMQNRPSGYVGEMLATMVGTAQQWSTNGTLISDPRFLTRNAYLDPVLTAAFRVAFLGRYFPPTDVRHKKHQLSQRILKAKDGDATRARPLLGPLGLSIDSLRQGYGFDLVTRVPPKPASRRDHVRILLEGAMPRRGFGRMLDFDALRCTRDYSAQKFAGSYANRIGNVAGVFQADPAVRERSVLIVDDVLTSGATLVECAETLIAAGARTVGALVLGVTQNQIHRPTVHRCSQPGCTGDFRLRFSTSSSSAFWGCSTWRPGGANCAASEPYRPGLQAYNVLNRRDDIIIVPNIDF